MTHELAAALIRRAAKALENADTRAIENLNDILDEYEVEGSNVAFIRNLVDAIDMKITTG